MDRSQKTKISQILALNSIGIISYHDLNLEKFWPFDAFKS